MFLRRCVLMQSEVINFVNDFDDIKERRHWERVQNFGERQMLFRESWDV